MENIPADEKSITVNIEDLVEEIASIKACNKEMKECIKRQDDEINKLKEKQKIYDRIIPVLITENRMLKQVIRNEAVSNTKLNIQTKEECMGLALNEICTIEKISEELQAINLRLEKNEKTLQKLQEQQNWKIPGLECEISNALKNKDWKECVKIIKENKPEHDTVYKQLQNVELDEYLPLAAADKGYVELIQLLLYNGLNVNAKMGNNDKSMLHRAGECGNNNLMELLLSKGAVINLNDNKGSTPLHSAAWNGHVSTVQLLIEKGADINSRNNEDWTPLHFAAYNGHVSTVQLLIEKGADIDPRDNGGSTPLHFAAYNGHVSTVQLLIEKGAVINLNDNKGSTPLHSAAWNGHVSTEQLLIEKGADINSRDNRGSTPLHSAAWNGHVNIVQILIEKGADINTSNKNEWTPLQYAAQNGHISVVQCLLDNHCNREIKNNDGKTALDMARKKGYSDIVRLLDK